jgi:hypothetical protein
LGDFEISFFFFVFKAFGVVFSFPFLCAWDFLCKEPFGAFFVPNGLNYAFFF